jgi:hypothetical protein
MTESDRGKEKNQNRETAERPRRAQYEMTSSSALFARKPAPDLRPEPGRRRLDLPQLRRKNLLDVASFAHAGVIPLNFTNFFASNAWARFKREATVPGESFKISLISSYDKPSMYLNSIGTRKVGVNFDIAL